MNMVLLTLGLFYVSLLLIAMSAAALGLTIAGWAISRQTVEIIDVALRLNAHL